MSNTFLHPVPPAKSDDHFSKSHETNLLMRALFEDAIASFKDIAAKYTEVCARLSEAPLETDTVFPEVPVIKRASRVRLMKRFVSAALRTKRPLKRIRTGGLVRMKKNRFHFTADSPIFRYPYTPV